jgi:hypothetical protein
VSMTAEAFEEALLRFKYHKPFIPFVVELDDGREILVERPKLAFNGGAATYIAPPFELIDFACENVRAIRHYSIPATP